MSYTSKYNKSKSDDFNKKLEAFKVYKQLLNSAVIEGRLTKNQYNYWVAKKAKQFGL